MAEVITTSSPLPQGNREDLVNTPSVEYLRAQEMMALPKALLGGTKEMRKKGPEYLPKEPLEEWDAYNNRRKRSFLFNAFKNTIEDLVGKPFSRPVQIQGEIPEKLQVIEDDVDREGTDITQFLREVFKHGVTWGLHHVFVEYPRMQPGASLADEDRVNARPYFTHVHRDQLIGWRISSDENGNKQLSQIRIKETRVEPVGRYLDAENEYIRVVNAPTGVQNSENEENPTGLGTWELWKMNDKGEYVLFEQGTHSFARIPLVTFYVAKTSDMMADIPLDDLAYLNLEHWQSSSDQRNCLRFARSGLLFMKGLTDEQVETGISLGPKEVFATTQENADAKYVEHSGAALGTGRDDIKDIEERMRLYGMRPLIETATAPQTATGKSIDESRAHTIIQSWIRSLEDAAAMMYHTAAEWLGLEIDDEAFEVNVFNDFGISIRAQHEVEQLIKARQAGEMSRETFLKEIKRRGLLSDTVDVEEEIERIEEEGPPLGLMGAMNEEAEEEEEDDGGTPPQKKPPSQPPARLASKGAAAARK